MKAQAVQTLGDFTVWGQDFSESIRTANQKNLNLNWAYQIEIYLLSIW